MASRLPARAIATRWLLLLTTALPLIFSATATGADEEEPYETASKLEKKEQWQEAAQIWEKMAAEDEDRPGPYHTAGVAYFFAGKIDDSLRCFDAFLEANPSRAPYHWQRGIALYYAQQFGDGRLQFETHQDVNSSDVENAAWHYICLAREKDVETAAEKLIPIKGDSRVPMAEIHKLFAGQSSETHVLVAASKGRVSPLEKRSQFCYAHLYLGLWHEAHGRKEEAKKHIVLAAKDYQMDHYMGRVAQVHAQIRGWLKKPSPK